MYNIYNHTYDSLMGGKHQIIIKSHLRTRHVTQYTVQKYMYNIKLS